MGTAVLEVPQIEEQVKGSTFLASVIKAEIKQGEVRYYFIIALPSELDLAKRAESFPLEIPGKFLRFLQCTSYGVVILDKKDIGMRQWNKHTPMIVPTVDSLLFTSREEVMRLESFSSGLLGLTLDGKSEVCESVEVRQSGDCLIVWTYQEGGYCTVKTITLKG